MPRTLLLKNATLVATLDDDHGEIADGAVLITDNRISAVGATADLPQSADEVIDLRGHVVIPGLVNTHHHMFQSLTRALPAAQNAELFDWLCALFPVWGNITPEMMTASATTSMAELVLSGCTTAADHAYLYVNGSRLEDNLEAAHAVGLRYHGVRGAITLGQSQGGLPPDQVVEQDEDAVLKEMQRVVETHHQRADDAMIQVALGPSSPFTVSPDLMRQSALLARDLGVLMHTHTAENSKDLAFSQERYGMTPAQFAEHTGWVGEDVWHAHCVHLDDHGIDLFGRTGTGVAHCPCSNMRLASGIAPIRKMLDQGVKVGLGVDGTASNDGNDLLGEARQAMLVARVRHEDPTAMSAREALWLATRGGARVLGRDHAIGRLAPGYCADLIAFDLNDIAYAGGQIDPLASLLFSAPRRVSYSFINGRKVVDRGRLATVDLPRLVENHNRLSRQLIGA
ncbi:MAG: 8-oxoguanine deaminase [Alcanivorax sp.]|nr:8-oxoguanine deaminase [Alcanivorax sp.]